MSNGLFSSAGSVGNSAAGAAGGAAGGSSRQCDGKYAEVALGEVDPLLVGLHEEVPAAGHGRVHARAAHLLEADRLADHHLRHSRRAEVHRGVAVAHDHDVAEGRDVGAARGARPEQHADLGNDARELDLGVEDPPRAAAAGEHLDLVGDARAGRVDQVDHRHQVLERLLLDADDLLDGLGSPRAGLDGRVVGHQRDRAPAHRGHSGDHAVGPEAVLLPVGEQRILDEGAGIDEPLDALAHGQLALVLRLVVVALRAAPAGALERLLQAWHRGRKSSRLERRAAGNAASAGSAPGAAR